MPYKRTTVGPYLCEPWAAAVQPVLGSSRKHALSFPPPLCPGPLHPRQPGQSISLPCDGIVKGRYHYINDLLRLSAGSTSHIVHAWPRYCTPIWVDNLCPFLASHPDQAFAAYIYEGLKVGFRISHIDSHRRPQSRASNHPSSLVNEAVVQERISAEVRAGRLLGPLPAHMSSLVHVSPVGLVPRPTRPIAGT